MEQVLNKMKQKDQLALEDFKRRVEDIRHLDEWKLNSNLFLFTWLRGAGMNVNNAESSIRKSFEWRAENQISETLDEETEEFQRLIPLHTDTYTDSGIPVLTIFGKQWDLRWVLENDKKEIFQRYSIQHTLRGESLWLEANERALEDKGVEVMYAPELLHFIISAKQVRYTYIAHPTFIAEFIDLMSILGGNFLGLAIDITFVDVPVIMTAIFNLMKPVLTFAGALNCYNCNRKKWMKAFSEFCQVDQLGHGFCDDSPVKDLLGR